MNARILVVDDSLVVQKLIGMNLRLLGEVEVVSANDGMEGLRFLTSEDFDLAFVDVNMPVMDGLTLLRLFREQENGPSLPIVMVTTERESTTGVEAIRLGASGYITKPIDTRKLRADAKTLIAEYREKSA